MKFQAQKYDKYLKSLKRPLGAFINELWAINVFWKLIFLKTKYQLGKRHRDKFGIFRSITYPENGGWVSEVLQKMYFEKVRFHLKKYEKYLKSKFELKRPLGSFIKEL